MRTMMRATRALRRPAARPARGAGSGTAARAAGTTGARRGRAAPRAATCGAAAAAEAGGGRAWAAREEFGLDEDDEQVRFGPHQERRLRRALEEGGRRQFSVKQLSRQTGIDRRDLLKWMKANGPRVLEEVNLKREREEERRRARASAFTNDVRSEPGAHGAPARGARPGAGAPGAPAGPVGNTDGYGRRHRKRLGVVARNTLEAYYEKDKYPSAAIVSELCSLLNQPPQNIRGWFNERNQEAEMRRKALQAEGGGAAEGEDGAEGAQTSERRQRQGALSSKPRRATQKLRVEMRKIKNRRGRHRG